MRRNDDAGHTPIRVLLQVGREKSVCSSLCSGAYFKGKGGCIHKGRRGEQRINQRNITKQKQKTNGERAEDYTTMDDLFRFMGVAY